MVFQGYGDGVVSFPKSKKFEIKQEVKDYQRVPSGHFPDGVFVPREAFVLQRLGLLYRSLHNIACLKAKLKI